MRGLLVDDVKAGGGTGGRKLLQIVYAFGGARRVVSVARPVSVSKRGQMPRKARTNVDLRPGTTIRVVTEPDAKTMNSGASDDVAPRNYRQEYEVAIFVGLRLLQSVGTIQDYGNVGDRFPAVTYEDALNRAGVVVGESWGDAEGGEDERDIASNARITHRERARDASVIANVVLYAAAAVLLIPAVV